MIKYLRMMALVALVAMPMAVAAQSTDSCTITVNWTDGYGDGWNGAQIVVHVNEGVSIGSVAPYDGESGSQTFRVASTDEVKFLWSYGEYDDECGFNIVDGSGVVVYSHNDATDLDEGEYFFEMSMPCPSCLVPTGLVVSDITETGGVLSWTAGDAETQWQVMLDGEVQGLTNVAEYSFSGLSANTGHTVQVRAVCDDDDMSGWVSTTFRTACSDATCAVSLNLSSSYSYYNPWNNGARVELWQDGTLVGSYNQSGMVEVCSSSPIAFVYNSTAGYYDYYAEIEIQDGGLNTIYSGGSGDTLAVLTDVCPSCIPPMVAVEETGEDYITINITPRGEENSFVLTLDGEVVGDAGEGEYTFSGLATNTAYTIGVAAVCDDDTTSYVVNSVRTSCSEMQLPYSEDFEGIEYNGAWPSCWTLILNYNTDPSVNYQYNNTPGGQYSMYLQAYNGNYNMFASSAVPLPGDQIAVTFNARLNSSYSGTAWIKAGVMTNPNDTSTFIPLLTITDATNSFVEYEFNTSTLDASATYYVAWLSYSTYSYSALGAIDDITISENTGCSRPEFAVVDSVDAYTATMHWATAENALSYSIYYSTTNDYNSDNVQTASSVDTSYTLTDLLPQTTYYAWVRSICAAGESDYKALGSFTTQLTCAPIINVHLDNVNYTAAMVAWDYDTTMGFPTMGAMISLVDNADADAEPVEEEITGNSYLFTNLEAGHSYTVRLRNLCQTTMQVDTAAMASFTFMTSSCAEIVGTGSQTNSYIPTYTYYGNSYTQMIYPAEDMPSVTDINGIAFNVTATTTGGNAVRTFDVYMGYIDTVAFANNSAWVPVSEMQLVATDKPFDASIAGWQAVNFDSTFVYDGSSNLVVAINDHRNAYDGTASYASHSGSALRAYRDGTPYDPATPPSGTASSLVPDVQFVAECEVPTCFAPMLTLDYVDSVYITVSWVPIGTESNFVVKLREGSAAYMYYGPTTSLSFTFNALTPNTAYTVAVGSVCGENDTLWGYLPVRTSCGDMVLPYTEDFENQTLEDAPTCWNIVESYTSSGYYGSTTYPRVYTGGYDGGNALQLAASGTCMVATSAIITGGLSDELFISFRAKVPSYGTVSTMAGMMTDPTDATTFVPMVTLAMDDEYHLYEFTTSGLDADSTYYLAFQHVSSYDPYQAYIDDVNIRFDDGCHRPQHLTATVDSNATDLEWGNDGTVSNYIVLYREHSSDVWTVADSTTDTAYYLTGLLAATHYEAMVGTMCPSGDTLWASVSFVTSCGIAVVPYFEDFDSPTGTLPECWDYTNASYFHWNRWTTHAETSGDGELMAGSNSAGEAVILPHFNAPFGKLEISFDGKVGDYTTTADATDGFLMGVYDEYTGTVTWADTLRIAGQSRENFVRFTYNYLNYVGTGDRIAIGHAHNNTSNDWGFALDNINVRELPDCFPPENISVNNTMYPNIADSINVTWTCSGDAVEWQLYYDTITSTVDIENVDTNDIITVNEMFYQMPAGTLDDGARYRLFIRSKCGIDHSSWVEVQNGFSTSEVWMSDDGNIDTIAGCNFIVFDNGGPVAGYHHNSNSALIIRSNDPGSELQLQGAFFNTGADANTFTVYDGEGTSGEVLYTYSSINTEDIFDSVLATTSLGAMTITFTSGYYAGLGYELYIHCVPGATCYRPVNVAATVNGPYDVTASWSGNAATYRVYYREEGTTDWTMVTTTDDNITLSALTPATTYQMLVRGICSATDSSANSLIVTFTTECAPITVTDDEPFVEDFESAEAPASCFTLVYGDNDPSVNTMTHTTSAAHNGERGFRFSSYTEATDYGQYLITPRLDATDNMKIEFYVKASVASETFRMGYSTSDTDLENSFTWNAPITVTSSWTLYSAIIPAAAKYVAINYMPDSSMYYLYVDSLAISLTNDTSACLAPAITAVEEDFTSVTVNYMAFGPVEAAITRGDWSNSIAGTLIPDSAAYTFSGLEPGATYTFGLRTVCDSTTYSVWTTRTVTTLDVDCDTPTDLAADNITFTSVSVDWNGGTATAWQFYYTEGSQEDTLEVTTHPVALNNLAYGTTYTVKIRAICMENVYGAWSTPMTFTTTGCAIPSTIYAGEVTANSAQIHWANGEGASSWTIEYGPHGFARGEGTTATATTNVYALNGLEADEQYDVYLRANCTDDIESAWSTVYTFRTDVNQGIDEVGTDAFSLYPNPASTSVTVEWDSNLGQVDVEIVDMTGRTVSSYRTNSSRADLDITALVQGTYFVRVVSQSATAVGKLIVR